MVDAIVLDHGTQNHVDALLESAQRPDPRLVGLSSAAREDRSKEIAKQGRNYDGLYADCRSFADLQALARIVRHIRP